MVWVQAWPTNNTAISQSVAQIQANWLFLQTNLQTDHYFAAGNATEGHHKYMQTLSMADPGVSAGMSGVLYNKTQGAQNVPQLFWQENVQNTVRQVPTVLTGIRAYPATLVIATIFDFNATPFVSGLFTLFQEGSADTYYEAFIVYDNVDVHINNPQKNGNFLINVLGTRLTFFSAFVTGNFRWNLITIPN